MNTDNKTDDKYDSYFKLRKPYTKSTIVLNGGVRRIKDKLRDEIEEGLIEFEEEYESSIKEINNG